MKKILSIVLVFAAAATTASAHDIILREQGKPILGVSYPSDWKQEVGKHHVVATSEDGTAWSVFSTMDDIKDKQAGIPEIKEGLEDYLKEIKYDELTETESGSLVLSGTGKCKESGADLVFTTAVFESGPERFSGIVFIVDADIEKYFEKTVLMTVESSDGGVIDVSYDGNSIWDALEYLVEFEEDYGSPLFSLENNAYCHIRLGIYSAPNDSWDYVYMEPYNIWSHWSANGEPVLIQLFVWNTAKRKWVGKDSAVLGLDLSNKYEAYKHAKRDYRLRMKFVLR